MISNQIIQTSIDELKAITKVDIYVFDLDGIKVAATTTVRFRTTASTSACPMQTSTNI